MGSAAIITSFLTGCSCSSSVLHFTPNWVGDDVTTAPEYEYSSTQVFMFMVKVTHSPTSMNINHDGEYDLDASRA